MRLGLILTLLAGAFAHADEIVFPKDAGILNVKDFGAKGDGLKDDTIALQKALDKDGPKGRIVYLPNGTYRVSETLTWPRDRNTTLQGQSREKVVVRLVDAAPGFANPEAPKAVILAGQGVRDVVRDVTVETGRKNSGAIGVRIVANAPATIRDMTIRSSDGKAPIGLDLGDLGTSRPLFVKDVKIFGFDRGVHTAGSEKSVTIEGLTLQDQGEFGLVNQGACLNIRGLTSRSVVTVVVNSGTLGMLTLIDADLRGFRTANAKPAVLNDAFLLARNVASVGYAETIRNTANSRRPEPGRAVAEFVSHPPLGDTVTRPKPLPVKETPTVPRDDLKDWASPTQFGAKADDDLDDAPAIQKAIDSGKTTIYFPRGTYKIGSTILVRGKARRLMGCEATIVPSDLKGEAAFRMIDGSAPVVVIERIGGGEQAALTLDNTSSRTLVVTHCWNIGGRFTGPGNLFLEDVGTNSSTGWRFGSQSVWARYLSIANEGTQIVNDGGKLWVLGLNSERGGTLIETRNGGVTEVRGGLRTTVASDAPMFVVERGGLTVTIAESCAKSTSEDVLVKMSKTDLKRGSAPARTVGAVLPLFVAPPGKD